MSKYDSLYQHLKQRDEAVVTLTYERIERLINDLLPASAHAHRPWWANDKSHVQAHAWLDAGYEVSSVDPKAKTVTFRKVP
jgi:hypothetical protein